MSDEESRRAARAEMRRLIEPWIGRKVTGAGVGPGAADAVTARGIVVDVKASSGTYAEAEDRVVRGSVFVSHLVGTLGALRTVLEEALYDIDFDLEEDPEAHRVFFRPHRPIGKNVKALVETLAQGVLHPYIAFEVLDADLIGECVELVDEAMRLPAPAPAPAPAPFPGPEDWLDPNKPEDAEVMRQDVLKACAASAWFFSTYLDLAEDVPEYEVIEEGPHALDTLTGGIP